MYTIALSGPERSRTQAEVALELAHITVLPSDAAMDWHAKFPEDKDSWLTVEHDDVDAVVEAVASAKWRLRVHYPTLPKPSPVSGQELAATIADMQAEIAALKERLSGV